MNTKGKVATTGACAWYSSD